jgi:anti-anti-sigma factor
MNRLERCPDLVNRALAVALRLPRVPTVLEVGKGGHMTCHAEGSAGAFQMRASLRDSAIEVVLCGERDMAAAFQLEPALERLLAASEGRALELDLAEVGFVDSAGLGTLLSIKDRATQLGIGFQILRASEPVRRVLDLTATRGVMGG